MKWVDILSVLTLLKSRTGTTPDNFTKYPSFTILDRGLIE